MGGPGDCPTDWIKSDTEREVSYDTLYIWTLKRHDDTNDLLTKQTLPDLREWSHGGEGGRMGGRDSTETETLLNTL